MPEQNLQTVVNRIKNLPTIPHIIPKLMRVLDNPNSTAAEVGKVISTDQALVAKILKLVNSAMYGLPRRISTLSQATVILGFNAVRSTAIAATVFKHLNHGSDDRMKFWEHALGCAVASKIIARYAGNQNAEEAFIAGLVHDIGKIIIDQYLSEDFQKIRALVETGKVRMIDAEEQVLGVAHTQIGGWLARKWNLPMPLLHTIMYHHQPNLAGHDVRIASIIHLGDGVARLAQIGSGGDNLPPIIQPSIWPVLGLSEAQVPALIEEITVDYANSTDFLHALKE
jgi:HD-like signal output (HDOD) protein